MAPAIKTRPRSVGASFNIPYREPCGFSSGVTPRVKFCALSMFVKRGFSLVCASPRSSRDCSPLLPRLRLLRKLCLCRLSGYQQEFPVLCLQSESVQSRNKDTSWYYDFSEPIEQQDRARVSNASNPALSRALCQLV